MRAGTGDQAAAPFITAFLDSEALIFGVGQMIADYWAAFEVADTVRDQVNAAVNPIQRQQIIAAWEQQGWKIFKDRRRGLRITGGADIVSRSNTFIQFTETDQMRIQTPHPPNHPSFGMRLEGNNVPQERTDFFGGFSASGYNVSRMQNDQVWKGIEKDWTGRGVQLSDGHRNFSPPHDLPSIRQYMVRRACKYLIYDEIYRRDGMIYYALDDIVLDAVVNKTALQLTHNRSKVPVCTSELREIFRMWSFLQNRVRFYQRLQPVAPPWQTVDPAQLAGWANYAIQRMQKLVAQRPGPVISQETLNAMQVQMAANNHAGVINQYHAIPHPYLPKRFLPVDEGG